MSACMSSEDFGLANVKGHHPRCGIATAALAAPCEYAEEGATCLPLETGECCDPCYAKLNLQPRAALSPEAQEPGNE